MKLYTIIEKCPQHYFKILQPLGVFVTLLLLSCSSSTPPTTLGFTTEQSPSKTMVYQVQDGIQPVGYLHRYEWEPTLGKIYYYYMAYDVFGNPVGSSQQDGSTILFTKSGTKKLGNFAIVEATAKMLGAADTIRIVPEPKEETELRLAQEALDSAESDWSWHTGSNNVSESSEADSAKDMQGSEGEDVEGVQEDSETAENNSESSDENKPSPENTLEEEWPDTTEDWPFK